MQRRRRRRRLGRLGRLDRLGRIGRLGQSWVNVDVRHDINIIIITIHNINMYNDDDNNDSNIIIVWPRLKRRRKKKRADTHTHTHANSGGGCTARVWDGFLAPYGEATAAINRVLIVPYGLLLCTHRYIT